MKAEEFKAVIFDFDGTLYDNSGIAKTLILSNPFRFFFMKAERDARRIFKGRDFETPENFRKEYYQKAAKEALTSPESFAYWFEKRYMKHMERALKKKKFHAHPKVDEVFEFFSKSGKKIALYSDYNAIKERALACGIKQESLDLCQGFYSSETFGCLKPAPRAFLQIAANLGTRPKDCLVVGDRDDTDGFGARMVGMKFIQIKTKSERPILDQAHPVIEWEEFAKQILG
ncbi:MAG: HAD family hydrolase [Treponema sp.]|nr:HAD family hydrolase [Treponema sp.]